MRSALLVVLLVASTAHANVWERAIATGAPDAAADKYEFEMKSGDEQTMYANARGISYRETKEHVRKAAESYRAAAAAKPDAGEPYFRLGMLLYSFYFECDVGVFASAATSVLCNPDLTAFDRKRADEVIAAWDAFEQRAPLDPRLSVDAAGDSSLLFRRAILHTKYGTREHLVAATKDYEKIIARSDDKANDVVWANLAETYMMVGRLDEAIDTYRQAIRRGGGTMAVYGLAVALDRDERGDAAREVVLSQSDESREKFRTDYLRGQVFFVPRGEEFYYFALIEEAYDNFEPALEYWQRYLQSGAHPEFQPRARQHVAAIKAQLKKKPALHLPLPFSDEIYP